MTLDFGGGAGHAEQFRGKAKRLAIIECDVQRAAIFGDADFYRPRRAGLGYAQGTVLWLNWVPPDTGKPLTVRPEPVGAGRADTAGTCAEWDPARPATVISRAC